MSYARPCCRDRCRLVGGACSAIRGLSSRSGSFMLTSLIPPLAVAFVDSVIVVSLQLQGVLGNQYAERYVGLVDLSGLHGLSLFIELVLVQGPHVSPVNLCFYCMYHVFLCRLEYLITHDSISLQRLST